MISLTTACKIFFILIVQYCSLVLGLEYPWYNVLPGQVVFVILMCTSFCYILKKKCFKLHQVNISCRCRIDYEQFVMDKLN